jgi:hypothetical protein
MYMDGWAKMQVCSLCFFAVRPHGMREFLHIAASPTARPRCVINLVLHGAEFLGAVEPLHARGVCHHSRTAPG